MRSSSEKGGRRNPDRPSQAVQEMQAGDRVRLEGRGMERPRAALVPVVVQCLPGREGAESDLIDRTKDSSKTTMSGRNSPHGPFGFARQQARPSRSTQRMTLRRGCAVKSGIKLSGTAHGRPRGTSRRKPKRSPDRPWPLALFGHPIGNREDFGYEIDLALAVKRDMSQRPKPALGIEHQAGLGPASPRPPRSGPA